MINLPKLDFLYFNLESTEKNYLNRRELYYDKVDWDERHFEDYILTCSFEELLYLVIYIYKDKYPREKFDSTISVDWEDQNLISYINTKERIITENKYIFSNFFRNDVISMNSQYHSEEYTDDEIIEKYWRNESYMQNLFLGFNKEIPIQIIDKALEGKEYTKTERDDILLYEVKDSPIATLEVTKNSIKLNINEDKVILYVSVW
jgi:hypothetical protein